MKLYRDLKVGELFERERYLNQIPNPTRNIYMKTNHNLYAMVMSGDYVGYLVTYIKDENIVFPIKKEDI